MWIYRPTYIAFFSLINVDSGDVIQHVLFMGTRVIGTHTKGVLGGHWSPLMAVEGVTDVVSFCICSTQFAYFNAFFFGFGADSFSSYK